MAPTLVLAALESVVVVGVDVVFVVVAWTRVRASAWAGGARAETGDRGSGRAKRLHGRAGGRASERRIGVRAPNVPRPTFVWPWRQLGRRSRAPTKGQAVKIQRPSEGRGEELTMGGGGGCRRGRVGAGERGEQKGNEKRETSEWKKKKKSQPAAGRTGSQADVLLSYARKLLPLPLAKRSLATAATSLCSRLCVRRPPTLMVTQISQSLLASDETVGSTSVGAGH